MKLVYAAVLLVIGYTVGEEVPADSDGGNLHREKKDIGKLEALLGWKNKPFIGGYPESRPVYAPLCNCWRPTTRPYNSDTVVVYPAQPALPVPRPLVIPAQPALYAPARVQPAQPAFSVNAAASALVGSDAPQPCPPGYSYDRPDRPFNH